MTAVLYAVLLVLAKLVGICLGLALTLFTVSGLAGGILLAAERDARRRDAPCSMESPDHHAARLQAECEALLRTAAAEHAAATRRDR